jgi:hypothetical protein
MTSFASRIRIIYAAFAGCLLLAPASPSHAAECKAVAEGAIVCGEGKEAMRVISATNSPNLHFAIAWRERDGEARDEPNPENVENILVRLSDGARLLTLGGNYWENDKFRANRRDEYAFWSKGSRFMLEISNDRWDTFSLRGVALDGDALLGGIDLLPLIEKETRALRIKRKGSPPDSALSFRVDEDEEHQPHITDKGEVVLRAFLFVPKSEDGQTAVDVRVQLVVKAGKLEARLVSARRVRG